MWGGGGVPPTKSAANHRIKMLTGTNRLIISITFKNFISSSTYFFSNVNFIISIHILINIRRKYVLCPIKIVTKYDF